MTSHHEASIFSGSAVSVKMASATLSSLSCLLLVITFRCALGVIPDFCIQCLCEAISGSPSCLFSSGCHDGVCGPYAITLPYWQDGGRPTVGLEDRNSPKTYENCALDPACAEATIRGYMNKFHQDCNGDGVEDCYDYAAIHFHGGYGCNKPLSVPARNALSNCMQRLSPPVNPVQPSPGPSFPNSEEPEEELDHNDIFSPTQQETTFPSIDVRLGGDDE